MDIENQVTIEQDKQIQEAIEKNMEKVRNTALIGGAKMICTNVLNIMAKHINKGNPSKRDLERCFKEIYNFVSVPLQKDNEDKLMVNLANLTEQSDSEESINDRTTE